MMERLTKTGPIMSAWFLRDNDPIATLHMTEIEKQRVLDRLAAYEDTGLTPEVINKWAVAVKFFEDADTNKLIELAEAEKEGRLIVLPCKVDATCKHALGGIYLNPVGEACLYCEIWDAQRNITLGDCLGNCESEEAEAAQVENGERKT